MRRRNKEDNLLVFLLHSITLIIIYAAYGLFQERILKRPYKFRGPSGNFEDGFFDSAPLLVVYNRLVSLITGILLVYSLPTHVTSWPLEKIDEGPEKDDIGRTQQFPLKSWILASPHRLRPSSPLSHYALVAFLNNLATLSQYMSLEHLSFTTTTLGKCAKMVPVLVLGYLVYGKRYKRREYVGTMVVVAGIWAYLICLGATAKMTKNTSVVPNWIGTLLLLSYLFFDGMTSTTQENLFGKAKRGQTVSYMGLNRAVLDQMVWVNFFSLIIALVTFLLRMIGDPSALESIKIAMYCPSLQLHMFLLSATATSGLLVLLNLIATHGALLAGLVMTLRQFVSIICNAVWFGQNGSVSTLGWAAIGVIAAGVWIKMSRQYDSVDDENGLFLATNPPPRSTRTWIRQYALPLLMCPSAFVFVARSANHSSGIDSIISSAESSMTREPGLGQLSKPISESRSLLDERFLSSINPYCPPGPLDSIKNTDPDARTAIATYTRSGSTYVRTLMERATGYQTSSIYCDKIFFDFFKGECDGYKNPWLVKTHFPSSLKHKNDTTEIHWVKFDRYLEIVRNPIDVLWSTLNLISTKSQTERLENFKLGPSDHVYLKPHLEDWNLFHSYWANAPIQGLVLRYEDIRTNPLAAVMTMLQFLSPKGKMPDLDRIACALTPDPEKEMYPSRKISPFQDWEEHFEPETFDWIIQETSEHWCRLGYDRLLLEVRGILGPVDCKAKYQITRTPVEFGQWEIYPYVSKSA